MLGRCLVGLVVLAAAGCQCTSNGQNTVPDGGGQPIAGLTSLIINPADAVLVTDGVTAATRDYQVMGRFSDGHSEDVTARVVLKLSDATLGNFSQAHFTSSVTRSGVAKVTAEAGMVSAETGLTVKLVKNVIDTASSAPDDAPTRFMATENPAKAPEIVYPNEGTMFPPNLQKLEIHFQPGPNELFELTFLSPVTELKVYLRCTTLGAGCVYKPSTDIWNWVAYSNRGGKDVELIIKGTDAAGTYVGTAAPLHISFSFEEVNGALYYWTTSGTTGIMRFDFGATNGTVEPYLGTELTGGTCVGCHALSRDGKKIVLEAGGQNDGRVLLMDVGTKKPLVPFPTPEKSIFESWNPDGTRYVGVYGDKGATDFNLMIFDGDNGSRVQSIANTGSTMMPANHPDWSHEGDKIAYTQVTMPNTLQKSYRGSIQVVTQNGGNWSTPVEIMAAVNGLNRYYPAFAPGGEFIIFNESTCPSGLTHAECDGDMDPTATLFAVKSVAGAKPVKLARANAPGKMDHGRTALANSFPKWNPFVFQRLDGKTDSKVLWLTFSTSRNYGLRASMNTQLWMVAVDPDAVARGEDPSSAAFALPFQDFTTSNHIAQWATQAVPVLR